MGNCLSKEEIDSLKRLSKTKRKAIEDSKQEACLLCGEKCSSFCNSHIIPQFVLNNIALNGQLHRGLDYFFFPNSPLSALKGVNNTWTFRIICNNCDQKYFRDYESEESLLSSPTTKMLAEIGLKGTMMQIAKRYYERAVFAQYSDSIKNKAFLDEEHALDLRDYFFDFKRLKKIIDKNLKSGISLVYYTILDYVTPIAMQGPIAVHRDLDGEIVNDVYDYNPNTKMQSLFCSIFPLKQKTVIILFHLRDDRNYVKFDKKFATLNDQDKLCYISYLVFKYCEHFAISPKIKPEILANENLNKLAKERNDSPKPFLSIDDLFSENQRLVSWNDVPNLLSKENSLSAKTFSQD